MKSLAIILSLSAAFCAEMVSITSLSNQNNNLKAALPEKCLQVNARQDCVKCLKDFEVKAGKCTPVVEPKPK